MKKTIKILYIISAALLAFAYLDFLLVYVNQIYDIGISSLVIGQYYRYILAVFFGVALVDSLVTGTKNRAYPIVFLIEIGVLLLFPEYMLMTLLFIPFYVYFHKNLPIRDSISYIVAGQFLVRLIYSIGLVVLVIGFVRFIQQVIKHYDNESIEQ